MFRKRASRSWFLGTFSGTIGICVFNNKRLFVIIACQRSPGYEALQTISSDIK